MSELTEFAKRYHAETTHLRIKALNMAQSSLIPATSAFIEVITKNNLYETQPAQRALEYIQMINNKIKNEILILKRAISIVRQCNQQYLMINTIQTDDDLRRYLDFMVVSHRRYEQATGAMCNDIETHKRYIQTQTNNLEMGAHDAPA